MHKNTVSQRAKQTKIAPLDSSASHSTSVDSVVFPKPKHVTSAASLDVQRANSVIKSRRSALLLRRSVAHVSMITNVVQVIDALHSAESRTPFACPNAQKVRLATQEGVATRLMDSTFAFLSVMNAALVQRAKELVETTYVAAKSRSVSQKRLAFNASTQVIATRIAPVKTTHVSALMTCAVDA